MSVNRSNPMAELYVMPVAELILSNGCSNSYNCLPGEEDNPENLAWVYYYCKLEKIEKDICNHKKLFGENSKKMLVLLRDVKEYISSCSGIDVLPNYWFLANTKLGRLKAEAQLAFQDLLSSELIEMIDNQEQYYVLEAFVSLVYSFCTEKEKLEIAKGINTYEMHFSVTPEEKEKLREKAYMYKNDYNSKALEGMYRKECLKKIIDIDEEQTLSKRALELKNEIESKDGSLVYHVIEDEEKIILLIVTDERLYWKNQRPSLGRLGLYAYGYVEHFEPNEQDGYGQVRIA